MSKEMPAGAKPECRGLQDLLSAELAELDYSRTEVAFLLGSDEFIRHERRVAMTPAHVARLRRDLEAAGLRPRIYAVAGAGERAGDDFGPAFTDAGYHAAGAEIVTPEEAASLTGLDVVHALKEPTEYESRLAGPLIRIGALHLASKPPGLCAMLKRKNFAAILDGGTVGSCSFLKYGGDRTPIVGSMSRFAGAVSGRKLVEAVQAKGLGAGRVVVVGGGIAGLAAIRKIGPVTAELVVVEPFEATRARLERILPHLGYAGRFRVVPKFSGELLDGAVGIVFAHRSGARAAEKICHYDDIRRMRRGAAVADIAIDQGGSIAHDGYREEDDATASRARYKQLLGDEYTYYAETNMPREEPHLASETHGDASLPYVTALLGLCALHGGPEAAVREISGKDARSFDVPAEVAERDLLDCVIQDLRNGLQLTMNGGQVSITDPDIERDVHLAGWVRGCAG